MASSFAYDPQILESTSQQVSSAASSIDGELRALSGRVTELQAGFQGQAANAYQELYAEWHSSSAKLLEALTGLAQLLHGAAANATQMEETNMKIMGR